MNPGASTLQLALAMTLLAVTLGLAHGALRAWRRVRLTPLQASVYELRARERRRLRGVTLLVLLVAMGCGPTLEECKQQCAGADRFEWTASSHQGNTCNCFSLGTPNAKPSAEAAP